MGHRQGTVRLDVYKRQPLRALRWELGDLWTEDGLSAATVMTLSESPLLLSARAAVLELWSSEAAEPTEPEGSDEEKTPVEETPLETLDFTDNGIPARTLVPTSSAGYTVVDVYKRQGQRRGVGAPADGADGADLLNDPCEHGLPPLLPAKSPPPVG